MFVIFSSSTRSRIYHCWLLSKGKLSEAKKRPLPTVDEETSTAKRPKTTTDSQASKKTDTCTEDRFNKLLSNVRKLLTKVASEPIGDDVNIEELLIEMLEL